MSDAKERTQLKIRLSDEVRRDIERAAKESGRSLTAEVEHRLESSIGLDDFYAMISRPDILAHTHLFSMVIELIEEATGERWYKDRKTREHVRTAISTIIDEMPSGAGRLRTILTSEFGPGADVGRALVKRHVKRAQEGEANE